MKTTMKVRIGFTTSLAALAILTGCASSTKESVTWEKKKGVTIIHHRKRTSSGALVDRIDAFGKNGAVSRAEIHVYDIGRYVDSSGNLHEAHQMYRVAQSSRPLLMLPKGMQPSGPKTVYTPPNYTPMPADQRINDAIDEARKAKEKLEAEQEQIQDRLAQDNNLRSELQAKIDENERLKAQIEAGMSTAKHSEQQHQETDAEKAAQAAVDPLLQWGGKQQ
jgi:transcriptional accessory protein Tex/SPT6